MKVLVTGAAGMLGTDLCAALSVAGMTPLATDIREPARTMQITDPISVREVFSDLRPDAVVHCAAFTDVDGCEREPDRAYRVNGIGSWVVASVCAERDIPVCAISTDFVFDGVKAAPYTEFDATNPLGVYGASKLAGENLIRQVCRKHWIVRTAWLYGPNGKCFPDSILKAAAKQSQLRVVSDQRGCPTYTRDLAYAIVALLQLRLYGTYHVTNSGDASWFEFAAAIVRAGGPDSVEVLPIASAEWPSPTRRPAYSVLRNYALELLGAPPLRPWNDALADYLATRHS